MIYLVQTTVHLCTNQDLLWDPRKDLLWLCRKYGKEIQSIRGHLNARQVKENFLGTAFFASLPAEEQRLCYHTLLGKDPPPSMFLTPAPSQEQATTRPIIPSHKSAPSLKDNNQQSSSFLRPPMHGKSKTAPGAPSTGAGMKAPSNTLANTQGPVSETARDSRSRYRNSSAPTTPSASRNVSPEARPAQHVIEFRPDHFQPHRGIYQAQSVNMQNLAPASKPQVVQTKKSLPRMNDQVKNDQVKSNQIVPVFAHKAKAASTTLNAAIQPASGAAITPSQPNARPHNHVSNGNSHNSALPSATSAQPQMVAHTHPAHKIMAQRNSIMPQSHHPAAINSAASFTHESEPKTISKGLAIVGPEGLYPTPTKPTTQPKGIQATAPAMHNNGQKSSGGFVFELDAASPQVETFAHAAPVNGFVAELPADSALPQAGVQRFNTLPETPISPPQNPAHIATMPAYRDSPVSPPTTFTALTSTIKPIKPAPQVDVPKTLSAPQAPKLAPSPPSFDALPASLMIGFRGHQQAANVSARTRASSQSSNSTNSSTAINTYQRYYSPPNSREASPNKNSMSMSSTRQPSPNRGPVYKAYTPPITPPMQPKTEPAQHQQRPTMVQSHTITPPDLIPATSASPRQGAPVPMDGAPQYVGPMSPPAILRAGTNVTQPLNPTKASHLPNPLSANPPTPRGTSHAKHDSHQGPQSEHAVRGLPVDIRPTHVSQQQPSNSPPSTHAPPPFQSSPHQITPINTQNTTPPHQPRQTSPHQRNISTDSKSSTTSHDSEKLAQEYQLDLPAFDRGYAAQLKRSDAEAEAELKKSYRPSYAGTGYGQEFKLGSPDLGSKQGRFMDEFHF